MEQTQNIEQYLRGCEFPCDRKDLQKAVQKNDAPKDIVQRIEKLPERRYQSIDDVQQAVGGAKTTQSTSTRSVR